MITPDKNVVRRVTIVYELFHFSATIPLGGTGPLTWRETALTSAMGQSFAFLFRQIGDGYARQSSHSKLAALEPRTQEPDGAVKREKNAAPFMFAGGFGGILQTRVGTARRFCKSA